MVPLGTGNVLGHYLGLAPGDLQAACGLIAEGRRRRIDAGSINGRYFVCMAGVGLDAEVAARTGGPLKRCLGRYAFMLQFVVTVTRTRPWEFEGTLFLCNTAQYTWRVSMAPDALEDDGQLEFVFLNACSKGDVLRAAANLFGRGKSAATQPNMQVLRGAHLALKTSRETHWQVEGEVGGVTPVACAVHPRAITLISAA